MRRHMVSLTSSIRYNFIDRWLFWEGTHPMPLNTAQTFDPEILRRFVADVLDLDPAAVTDDAHFVADLGMDSLRALEVLVALEKEYQIKISEEEVKDMTCFDDVRELVTGKLSAA